MFTSLLCMEMEAERSPSCPWSCTFLPLEPDSCLSLPVPSTDVPGSGGGEPAPLGGALNREQSPGEGHQREEAAARNRAFQAPAHWAEDVLVLPLVGRLSTWLALHMGEQQRVPIL